MGFENCEVGFGKNMNWEMGLVMYPPSGASLNVSKYIHTR